MSGVNLQAIYDRLRNVPAYHPMSANTYADWSMEAGDMVTVSRNGIAYKSPVGSSTVKWTGKQQIQIQSEGSRERDPISRVSARKYATGGGGTSGIRANQSLYYEMFSEDGQLHAVISATAESLTVDYTKRISDKGIELEGKIDASAERLTIDYTKKIDDKGVELEGKISATAERLTIDYTDKIGNVESAFDQRAGQIELSVSNLDDRLSAQIAVTDRTASMSVGRVKYSNTLHYANKASFPAVGRSDTLYYADDTRTAYIYIPEAHFYAPADVDEYGNANYIKAGEIVIAINENGDTEAKLDADVIYAGRNTKQTLAGLELPDWMDTTEGLVAEKATIVDLKAVDARVETLEADTITTKTLSASIAALSVVNANGLNATNNVVAGGYAMAPIYYIGSPGNAKSFSSVLTDASVSGNTLTITKVDGTTLNFSKATSLSGAWSGDKFTVTASPQNVPYDVKVIIDQNFTPSGQSSAIKIIKPSARGANWLRVQQQVGDLSSGSRTIKTIVGSTPIEETTITDYNDGFNAVSKPSVTYTDLGDTTLGNVSGTASISNKTDGTTRSTSFSLSLDKTTYTPSQAVGAKSCVVVKTSGNVVVGRIDTSVKLQEKSVTSNGDVYPDTGYDGMSKVTVDVPTGGGEISIPRENIYTTDKRPSGTNASKLRNNYEQARSDGEYVVFQVTCGDASRWYYMEP